MSARGGTTHTEWMVEVDRRDGNGFQPHPDHRVPYVDTDQDRIRAYMRGIIYPKRLMRRSVRVGPWRVEVDHG